LYSNLLQDSYFTRNFLHLSGIITLGNLKLNVRITNEKLKILAKIIRIMFRSASTAGQRQMVVGDLAKPAGGGGP